jgi:hypothetical protein
MDGFEFAWFKANFHGRGTWHINFPYAALDVGVKKYSQVITYYVLIEIRICDVTA